MARIKRGVTSLKRHKKLLELAKGYRMSRHRLVKVAQEAVLHAGEYAFGGRKRRKRQFRRMWIVRMNAGLREMGIKYSAFISMLKKQNILIDRKIFSFMAQEPKLFKTVVENIKK